MDVPREVALRRKLDRLAKLTQEIADDARKLYGPDAWVFAEAEGGIHIMDGDAEGTMRTPGAAARQEHMRISSTKTHALGVGAW